MTTPSKPGDEQESHSERSRQVESALQEARSALEQLYGDRLRHLILFGSQARGTAHPESDVDILMVLAGSVDYAEEVKRVLDLELDLLERHGLLISLMPVSEDVYARQTHPLIRNVQAEGIIV
jgi:predicted nucleotidyltransferase